MARPSSWERLRAGLARLRRAPRPAPDGRTDHGPPDRRPRRRQPVVELDYRPERDGEADPGEVVWAWVPFEEDPGQGKDRPVVVIGRFGPDHLAVVMLTSKSRPGDTDRIAVDRGPWDAAGRPSYARIDRILALRPRQVRREGATLDRARFERLTTELTRRPGWPAVPVEVIAGR